jgi:hypothetical protein
MLGLVQCWEEVFSPWTISLAGRRVPIALAVILAALLSVLLLVGGVTIFRRLRSDDYECKSRRDSEERSCRGNS